MQENSTDAMGLHSFPSEFAMWEFAAQDMNDVKNTRIRLSTQEDTSTDGNLLLHFELM
jgi:hypothetical protein